MTRMLYLIANALRATTRHNQIKKELSELRNYCKKRALQAFLASFFHQNDGKMSLVAVKGGINERSATMLHQILSWDEWVFVAKNGITTTTE